MFQWLLLKLLTLSVLEVYAEDINCVAFRQCQIQNISCEHNATCNIHCSKESCRSSTINCAHGYECNIHVARQESAYRSIINGQHATNLSITTSSNATSSQELKESFINCPVNGTCIVECNDSYENCRDTTIKAEYSNSLHVKCVNDTYNVYRVCMNIHIWCPIKGLCEIEGYTHTSMLYAIDIYAAEGFKSVNVTGISTGYSIGTIHCLNDYSLHCTISKDNNNKCDVASGAVGVCDRSSPFLPTNDPTESPSQLPTELPSISPTTPSPTVLIPGAPTITPNPKPTTAWTTVNANTPMTNESNTSGVFFLNSLTYTIIAVFLFAFLVSIVTFIICYHLFKKRNKHLRYIKNNEYSVPLIMKTSDSIWNDEKVPLRSNTLNDANNVDRNNVQYNDHDIITSINKYEETKTNDTISTTHDENITNIGIELMDRSHDSDLHQVEGLTD